MRLLLLACALSCVLPGLAAAGDGFLPLFNGRDLDGWFVVNRQGPGFLVEDGLLVCPREGGQKLMTAKQYANFVLRFDFRMEPDGNNGIGIRAPRDGHTSTKGIEIQILHEGPRYSREKLRPEQLHGSIYDVVPARSGYLKPPGEWNSQEILADGSHVRVTLNGAVILDFDLALIQEPTVLAKHPGLRNRIGHIALLGHQSRIEFREILIRELP
jgi:hypothetical protein